MVNKSRYFFLMCVCSAMITACEPSVKIEAPEKPIVINLNIKLEEEVVIKLDKEVDKLLTENEELF